jgi:PIN domain nuclease of toxin-antitoxin system
MRIAAAALPELITAYHNIGRSAGLPERKIHVGNSYDADHDDGGGSTAGITIPNLDEALRGRLRSASIWEISIKSSIGKLSFRGSPTAAVQANGFQEILIGGIHGELAGRLPWIHRDPFDRMIVATALIHDLAIVTSDARTLQSGLIPQNKFILT